MIKRTLRILCCLLCALALTAALLPALAQPVRAVGEVWENKADVSWIDPSKKLVAFTFDDGPYGTNPSLASQRILSVMEQYGMHCTFFYWGEHINDDSIHEIERAYSLGCEIGNHSFTHPHLRDLTLAQIHEEIRKTNELLYTVTGNEVTVVRPPYGETNNTVAQGINAPMINWSRDSGDWNNGNVNSVLNQLRAVQDGDIILMHETYDFTAEAVETVVPELIAQGFQIVSVSELMKMKGVDLVAGTLYQNQARNKPNVYVEPPYEKAIRLIDAIGTVTLESEEAILAAREAYDALTDEQKALVSNYSTLVLAEVALDNLQFAEAKNRAAAEAVERKIDAIGTVTLKSETAIRAAREAYDALTDVQKERVSNYALLCQAEQTLEKILQSLIFTDVSKSAYYADAVAWAVMNEITSGTTETTFSPGEDCTRSQVVTFLWRASGSPAPKTSECPFTDVREKGFYYRAMLWAVENGVTTGTSKTTFSPGESCTRGQVVTFLWRASGSPAPKTDESPFTDVRRKGFYYNAMLWAVENGVTTGTSETAFSPETACTRGQVVTFLYRADAAKETE